jgi:hypothetical protein
MSLADVINLHRFVGLIEGVVLSLPADTQNAVYDYLETVNCILDKELQDKAKKGGAE